MQQPTPSAALNNGTRFYVWPNGDSGWRHPLDPRDADAVDCTDMDDAQFEQHIRSITGGAQ